MFFNKLFFWWWWAKMCMWLIFCVKSKFYFFKYKNLKNLKVVKNSKFFFNFLNSRFFCLNCQIPCFSMFPDKVSTLFYWLFMLNFSTIAHLINNYATYSDDNTFLARFLGEYVLAAAFVEEVRGWAELDLWKLQQVY